MPRNNRKQKQAEDPSKPVDVTLPGGVKAKAKRTSTLVIMQSRRHISSEQSVFGQKFSDDWALVNQGGKSSPELGVFVDNSGSSGGSGIAKALDAAARVRQVREQLDDEHYTVLVMCACMGWGIKELSEHTRENTYYLGGILRRALDTTVVCYAGRRPKPSRLVKLGEKMLGTAHAEVEGPSDAERRRFTETNRFPTTGDRGDFVARHQREPGIWNSVEDVEAVEVEAGDEVVFRSIDPVGDSELADRIEAAYDSKEPIKIPGRHGKFRITGFCRVSGLVEPGPWFLARGKMIIRRETRPAV